MFHLYTLKTLIYTSFKGNTLLLSSYPATEPYISTQDVLIITKNEDFKWNHKVEHVCSP